MDVRVLARCGREIDEGGRPVGPLAAVAVPAQIASAVELRATEEEPAAGCGRSQLSQGGGVNDDLRSPPPPLSPAMPRRAADVDVAALRQRHFVVLCNQVGAAAAAGQFELNNLAHGRIDCCARALQDVINNLAPLRLPLSRKAQKRDDLARLGAAQFGHRGKFCAAAVAAAPKRAIHRDRLAEGARIANGPGRRHRRPRGRGRRIGTCAPQRGRRAGAGAAGGRRVQRWRLAAARVRRSSGGGGSARQERPRDCDRRQRRVHGERDGAPRPSRVAEGHGGSASHFREPLHCARAQPPRPLFAALLCDEARKEGASAE